MTYSVHCTLLLNLSDYTVLTELSHSDDSMIHELHHHHYVCIDEFDLFNLSVSLQLWYLPMHHFKHDYHWLNHIVWFVSVLDCVILCNFNMLEYLNWLIDLTLWIILKTLFEFVQLLSSLFEMNHMIEITVLLISSLTLLTYFFKNKLFFLLLLLNCIDSIFTIFNIFMIYCWTVSLRVVLIWCFVNSSFSDIEVNRALHNWLIFIKELKNYLLELWIQM